MVGSTPGAVGGGPGHLLQALKGSLAWQGDGFVHASRGSSHLSGAM